MQLCYNPWALRFIAIFFVITPQLAFADDTSRFVEMSCGALTASIVCRSENKTAVETGRLCVDNQLYFSSSKGKRVLQFVPQTHDPSSTPYSLTCMKGNDGKFYLAVEYLSGEYSCSKCHISEIYDGRGNRLSEKQPVAKIFAEKKLRPSSPLAVEQPFKKDLKYKPQER